MKDSWEQRLRGEEGNMKLQMKRYTIAKLLICSFTYFMNEGKGDTHVV